MNNNLTDFFMKLLEKIKTHIPEWGIIDIFRLGEFNTHSSRPIVKKSSSRRFKKLVFETVEYLTELNFLISDDLTFQKRNKKKLSLKAKYLFKKQGEKVTINYSYNKLF